MKMINRWWMRDMFDFHVKLPCLSVSAAIMMHSYCSMEYIYCAFKIKFIKWEISFAIGDSYKRLMKKNHEEGA
jgi:hypothetical protein